MSQRLYRRRRSKFFGPGKLYGLPRHQGPGKTISKARQFANCKAFAKKKRTLCGPDLPRFLPAQTPMARADKSGQRASSTRKNVSNNHEGLPVGNTALPFPRPRLTGQAFAKFRWCRISFGPQSGGAVEGSAPDHFESMAKFETKIPTEVLVSIAANTNWRNEGLYRLDHAQGLAKPAAFLLPYSTQKAKFFGNSEEAKLPS